MDQNLVPEPPKPAPAIDESDASQFFSHQLKDGAIILVGKPEGVLRLRLRTLLGDLYKENEYKTIGEAFLSIRKWKSGFPSPLTNPTQFEALLSRFGSDDDLDAFMDKWQKLTQPELTKIVAEAFSEALEKGLSDEATQKLIRDRTAPLAQQRLDRLRDS